MQETKLRQKQLRGFATMDPQRVREIASLGGRTAHSTGRAHQFTSEEARIAVARKNQLRRNLPQSVK